ARSSPPSDAPLARCSRLAVGHERRAPRPATGRPATNRRRTPSRRVTKTAVDPPAPRCKGSRPHDDGRGRRAERNMEKRMHRVRARRGPATTGIACAMAAVDLVVACSSSGSAKPDAGAPDAGVSPDVAKAVTQLGAGDWSGALATCVAAEKANGDAAAGADAGAPGFDCDARYCELVARSMLVVNQINSFLLPRYRRPLTPMPGDAENLQTTNTVLDAAIKSADTVTHRQCEFDLPALPRPPHPGRPLRQHQLRPAGRVHATACPASAGRRHRARPSAAARVDA